MTSSNIRNSKAIDVIKALREYGLVVTIYDPLVNSEEVKEEYNFKSFNTIEEVVQKAKSLQGFDAIVLTVAHQEF